MSWALSDMSRAADLQGVSPPTHEKRLLNAMSRGFPSWIEIFFEVPI